MSSLSSSSSNPAAEVFASATLEIVDPRHEKNQSGSSTATSSSSPSVHKTRAYYRDSSGRARVHLRVRLAVPATVTENGGSGVEALLECGCIRPVPVESSSCGIPSSSSHNINRDDDVEESKNADEREDKQNDGNDEGDDDSVWQSELSTIGKEMKGGSKSSWFTDTTCTFECTIAPSRNKSTANSNNTTSSWALEGVTILHSEIERLGSSSDAKNPAPVSALLFDIEIAVAGHGVIRNADSMVEMLEEGELELCAALRQMTKHRGNDGDDDGTNAVDQGSNNRSAAKSLLGGKEGAGIAAGLLGLEFGGGSLSPGVLSRGLADTSAASVPPAVGNSMEVHYGTRILRTSPALRIHATLVPPLQLTVREVCGARAASGSTLVEVTVEHPSGWHGEDVTVTGIAFHPGQSRLWEERGGNRSSEHEGEGGEKYEDGTSSDNNKHPSEGKSMQGGELSVIDMSRRVRWGFAPGSAPDLPLVLGPYEAFATVMQVDAGEDVRSRAFLSPISVNAMVGGSSSGGNQGEDDRNNADSSSEALGGERVMVTTDARWTSSRVGIENSDAFRVDMSLRGGSRDVAACRVGAPLVVSLRVLNLSMEPRDLMLLMAKDGEGRNNGGLQWERPVDGRRRRIGRGGGNQGRQQLLHQHSENAPHNKENHSFNTAVVSEVNGYTFGVWGLSGDDDGTTRHHRDHELLAVDAALLLGEVKGQHSIEAELRFVPLREGTLDVPNLKLYDKRGMKWYNCVHTLKIVARQSNV